MMGSLFWADGPEAREALEGTNWETPLEKQIRSGWKAEVRATGQTISEHEGAAESAINALCAYVCAGVYSAVSRVIRNFSLEDKQVLEGLRRAIRTCISIGEHERARELATDCGIPEAEEFLRASAFDAVFAWVGMGDYASAARAIMFFDLMGDKGEFDARVLGACNGYEARAAEVTRKLATAVRELSAENP